MAEKLDVWQGTLTLVVLRTLDVLGPLHGYGIARRIAESGSLRGARAWQQTTELIARLFTSHPETM